MAEFVKRLSRGELDARHAARPRARNWDRHHPRARPRPRRVPARPAAQPRRDQLDALAIALSYTLIIVMANALGVVVALTLHLCGLAAVGAPPVVQVVVDVLGITLTCLVCTAVLS